MKFAATDITLTALTEPLDRKRYKRLQALRMLIAVITCYALAQLLDLNISSFWLGLACVTGVLLGGKLSWRAWGFLKVFGVHIALYVGAWLLLDILNFITTATPNTPASWDFVVPLFADKIFVLFLFYLVAFFSSWLFWRWSPTATLEAVIFSASAVWLLGGHRNYHLDAPKQISSLTWKWDWLMQLHAEPQHLLLALASVFAGGLVLYFFLASSRPLFGRPKEVQSSGRTYRISAVLIPLLLFFFLGFYVYRLNQQYSEDMSRATEGVGQTAKEGESNLGFHSAIGETKQPAALVRLEGDYAKNPWAPMLYFREGALSEFNGHELVTASSAFDLDVPRVSPGQPFVGIVKDGSEDKRAKLAQSVYLLNKHNAPFAVDYPERISQIKNPDPDRFSLAYQAVSLAPVTNLDALTNETVGNSHWDRATLDHYLRAPGSLATNLPDHIPVETDKPVKDERGEDLRYRGLMTALVSGISLPIEQTKTIIKYLSDESIYTRSPGHSVTDQGDPVAPYLFAEKKRGYCVHFAHAAVYMLRLAGIPARIGTGYLTDLSYAKDGHILLQMGDRHAWPEIYIDGYGWAIVDINPAQAENEVVPIPDEKLLEELMSKIDPSQEILDEKSQPESTSEKTKIFIGAVDPRIIVFVAAILALTFLYYKIWLRVAYKFTNDEREKIRLAYRAFASQMVDLGFAREGGETRSEYSRRLENTCAVSANLITQLNEKRVYSSRDTKTSGEQVISAIDEFCKSHDAKNGKFKRYASVFSPRALFRLWSW